jgi:hypothetical protein
MKLRSRIFKLRQRESLSQLLAFGVTPFMLTFATSSLAGPPYLTDDPEPVEYRHWEFYLASQHFRDLGGWSGTAPHFEVNYGVVPDVQLHLIAPLAYAAPIGEAAHYGFGDTELGVKFRFVHEGKWVPQIGTFPFLEVPTGSQVRGLGTGSAQVFAPVWFQKSSGEWTTYGGGGPWFDTSGHHDHWWYFGWQAQRHVSKALTVGAELFHLTPGGAVSRSDTRYNLGGVIDLNDTHHLLLSFGRSIVGFVRFQGYIAWQVTVGPSEDEAR